MNKRTAKAILAALSLSILSPTIEVQANETTNTDIQTEDTQEKLKELGKRALQFFVETGEKADQKKEQVEDYMDKTIELNIYKHESLWLITDLPNTNPNEKRHYYFVDKNSPTLKWTTYYDAFGNKVKQNDPTAVRKYEQIRYFAIGDSENRFMIRNDYNLLNNTWTTNYIDFDTEYLWEEETILEFGRFGNMDDIIPKDMQKEKYSNQDLQKILEVINDCEYEMTSDSLKKEQNLKK